MKTTLAIRVVAMAVAGCSSSALNSSDGPPADASGGGLKWYQTCGAPICGPFTPDAGAGNCASDQKVGASCASSGSMCDPGVGCGVMLRCTDKDPRTQPGGCPISRLAYKTDVRYLGPADLARLERETRALRLAHYRYRSAPERERLGFLIDDAPASPAVDEPRDMIDLYAYTSMVVATVQRQAARLDAQAEEIAHLRAEIARLARRGR